MGLGEIKEKVLREIVSVSSRCSNNGDVREIIPKQPPNNHQTKAPTSNNKTPGPNGQKSVNIA